MPCDVCLVTKPAEELITDCPGCHADVCRPCFLPHIADDLADLRHFGYDFVDYEAVVNNAVDHALEDQERQRAAAPAPAPTPNAVGLVPVK